MLGVLQWESWQLMTARGDVVTVDACSPRGGWTRSCALKMGHDSQYKCPCLYSAIVPLISATELHQAVPVTPGLYWALCVHKNFHWTPHPLSYPPTTHSICGYNHLINLHNAICKVSSWKCFRGYKLHISQLRKSWTILSLHSVQYFLASFTIMYTSTKSIWSRESIEPYIY